MIRWFGKVQEFTNDPSRGDEWCEVRLALPWWPEEPVQTWMVPGTYREDIQFEEV